MLTCKVKQPGGSDWVSRTTNMHVHRVVFRLLSVYFTWEASEDVRILHSILTVSVELRRVLADSLLETQGLNNVHMARHAHHMF